MTLGSFSYKLTLLFFSTVLLVGVVTHSLWNVIEEQKNIENEMEIITQAQFNLELLRNQLSLYLQYKDDESFTQLTLAQNKMTEQIHNTKRFQKVMTNLERMNNTLERLLLHEKNLAGANQQAKELLHSRYNMIVQSMDEELSALQRNVLEERLNKLRQAVFTSGFSLAFFTLLISSVTYLMLKRFRKGFKVLRLGLDEMGSGNMESRITSTELDEEFAVMANCFNSMKDSLQQSTVTREHLEQEVLRQTAELREQKEQLVYLSEKDPLTGLNNRRAFMAAVENATAKANRTGLKMALLFIDLNKFKEINDTFGHYAGDEILRQVACRMEVCFRNTDILGRIGGDEFVVCLDLLKDYNGVLPKAEKFARMVSEPIDFNGEKLHVYPSIGISFYPDQTRSINHLVKLADEDMYRAKNSESVLIWSSYLFPEEKQIS
ncbi:sensor domain-containing diguanylate cyclase [Vibrio navarrensis]|uniref:sensor domain-containing diguanylate cyclase n=2 Tax=Vibrio navarrensis TaxID=29495 RepID=UPI00051CEDBD|nr:diguanylate cyclase [Vibrio navarrensis]KGK14985.1 diguanylate cyclase [Vibrio navarrensis]